jgi:endonuclease/exonuclease/phosphatase family metal-dependent hydrolase
MKKILFSFLIFSCCFLESKAQIKVMTFNIRYDNKGDSLNQWSNRKEHAAELIKFHGADFIGMQEALINQIKDLATQLPDFAWMGKGRDDGKEAGEFSPIMYQKKKFTLLKTHTFWLSDSCEKVGFGWDAVCRRVVTYGYFKENKTGKTFYVFNTHFDHKGQVARRESSKLVLKKMAEIAGKQPAILTGDFNAKPDSEPIQIITNESDPLHLTDAEKISKTPHYGPYGTFNGFKSYEVPDSHIDYIFVKNGVKCLSHATHSEAWGGRFPSDHFPVSAVLVLP